MSKRTLILVAVILLVGVFLATGFHRVPTGEQELVRNGREVVGVRGEGIHFTGWGSHEVLHYPVGEFAFDFPRSDAFRVLNARSLETDLAMHLRLQIPEGSAEAILRDLGSDMDLALDTALQRITAAQAGNVEPSAGAEELRKFSTSVGEGLQELLRDADIELLSCEVTRWEPVGGDAVDRSLATADPPRKLILVGIDGADWTIIDPMIAEGKLPNFARLRSGGATGKLRSLEPILSPLLWTTMATGMLPEVHGVLDFNVTDPATGEEVPVNRMHRKVDAVWNMLGDYGRSVAVIGWLATHPPERVNGLMVSDRLGLIAQGHTAASHLTPADVVMPPERATEVAAALRRQPDFGPEELKQFMDIDEDLFTRSRDLEDGADRRVSNFMSLLATARTYEALSNEVLDASVPDFFTVYSDFVDASCHLFMDAAPPKTAEISDEDYARFHATVEAVYVEQDRILGEFMDRAGPGTVLMVVSDHGFKSGSERLRGGAEAWTGQAPKWHRLDGIIGFWGDGVRRGATIEGAKLLDVAPTILALTGLPGAEDMAGRVVTDAFEPDLVGLFSPNSLPTLERRRADESTEWKEDPAVSEEITRKLQALGYVAVAEDVNHRNLGERHQTAGEFAKAIPEYRLALKDDPDDHTLLNNLGICLEKVGDFAAAEHSFLAALKIKPDDAWAMNNLAVFYLGRRQPTRAIPVAERAVQVEPGYANAHLTLGSAYGMTGQLDRAKAEFLKVLEIEPDDARAKANLEKIRQARGGGAGS